MHKHTINGKRRGDYLTIKYGLSWLRGNAKPHFSITADVFERSQWVGGGCMHEGIQELTREYDDLIALHLSDIDGVPMHAAANGFYWMGGTHWQRPNLDIAAKHLRVGEDVLREQMALFGDHFSEAAGFTSKSEAKKAEARFTEWVETLKPQWKAEADAAIVKFSLIVPEKPE